MWKAKKFKRSFLGVKVTTCIFKGTMICNKLCIEVLICKREKNSRKILLDNFSTNFSKGRRLIYLFFKIINLLGGNSKKSNHTFCTEHLMRNFNFYFSLYLVLDLDLQRGMLVPCFYLQIYPQRIVPAHVSLHQPIGVILC